jgi:hypothetical protein
MLGFIRLISAESRSETQHFEGHIILLDPFNPTYQDVELRLIASEKAFQVATANEDRKETL